GPGVVPEWIRGGTAWTWALAVFAAVLVAQLALVAATGTDIPFQDQWNIEGERLYPAWRDGTWRMVDLFQPLNEHRIFWSQLLNLGLFAWNGQWDPLVQLVVIALLRAGCAAGIAWAVMRTAEGRGKIAVAVGVTAAFLPVLSWHNVLWGIQSQVYFCLGFSVLALAWLGAETWSWRRLAAGVVCEIAALFAMGPSALVPVALLGLAAVRAVERRRIDRGLGVQIGVAAALLGLALALRVDVPEHAALKASGPAQFLSAVWQVLGWPHVNAPFAAVAVNVPVLLVVAGRIARRRAAAPGEDFVLLLAGWSVAIGLATAWARGGSAELSVGVPSRYVDLIVLLPLANVWCVVVLAREVALRWRSMMRLLAGAWGVFLVVGWSGLSAEVMRGLVLPRARDREAPVRLAVAYQKSGNAAVFAGQPRLLVPHPNPESVRAVLTDPRLSGALPPSLQPERPLGPISRAVRWILGR
ncbi:MAG: hypothetical protein NTV51_26695, partial [Verrucomicrobia bacterium]|nr:hypothetical protein [Verrucomicrobiota bacterium]